MKTLVELLGESIKAEVLTDDLKKEIQTIFEASVTQKANEMSSTIVTENEKACEKKIQDVEEKTAADLTKFKAELVEKMNDYATYVVNDFVKENKPVLESLTEVKIAKQFFNNIKQIFTDASVDITVENRNTIDELRQEYQNVQESLKDMMNQNIALSKELVEFKKASIIASLTEDLTVADKHEVIKMMEGITVTNLSDFKAKTELVIEKFVNKNDDNGNVVEEDDKNHDEVPPNKEGKTRTGVNRFLPNKR